MTAADLLTTLRSKGLTVAADGDALTVRPRELLTDELRAAIKAHKRDLLAELPRYRWVIAEHDGRRREVCCLPEMSRAELAPCYPGARLLPLPDAAAEAAPILDQHARARHDGDLSMSGSGNQNGATPLGAIEPPDAWASMGRGVTDLYEPVMQTWLNATSPQQAAAYRKRRAEDERLYQRGFLSANPQSQSSQASNPYPWLPPMSRNDQTANTPPDMWREAGRYLTASPLLLVPGVGSALSSASAFTPEALASTALTGGVYQSLDALRRKLGVFE